MKKIYMKPESTTIKLNTQISLLGLSGQGLGNEQKDGTDYSHSDDFDW